MLRKTTELNIKQSHYLINVMRKKIHDTILVFNEINGEFLAEIQIYNKKLISVEVIKKNRKTEKKTDVWVLFAPVKKTPTEYIIQKATELGASKIIPVITERTITKNLNLKRFQDIAIEASEQCERITIPEILPLQKLYDVIDDWVEKRTIYYGDETMRHDKHSLNNFNKSTNASCGAVLVGPEGGFTTKEISYLKQKKFVIPINFGPRILKSDTAVVTALVLWHTLNGDMKNSFY
jgi:16S rRNA (uracil1498-N3)-methyltransferase